MIMVRRAQPGSVPSSIQVAKQVEKQPPEDVARTIVFGLFPAYSISFP